MRLVARLRHITNNEIPPRGRGSASAAASRALGAKRGVRGEVRGMPVERSLEGAYVAAATGVLWVELHLEAGSGAWEELLE